LWESSNTDIGVDVVADDIDDDGIRDDVGVGVVAVGVVLMLIDAVGVCW
jgi:hypothetical protein